jgi:hypothetical protein
MVSNAKRTCFCWPLWGNARLQERPVRNFSLLEIEFAALPATSGQPKARARLCVVHWPNRNVRESAFVWTAIRMETRWY